MSILSPNKSQKKQLDFINKVVDKKELNRLLAKVYAEMGMAKTGTLANNLKDLGFRYATKAGVTISIDDLSVPEAKKSLINDAEAEIERATQRFMKGEITEVERYTKVIDTWSETTEKLTKSVVDNFDRLNPVYMMAFSGARGNISQVRQLVGMRGLMADAQGQIIDLPIKSNFREGLSVTEYIISSYGARKGLVDTALKTADSGYLTRRLVDVAQDVIIQEADCGTTNGIPMRAIMEGESEIMSLVDRVISRAAAVNVVNEDGEVLVPAGEIITLALADVIEKSNIKEILMRSVLTCESQVGICQKCYGWSLTSNKIVDIGEAIGIIAAQSIGEPGTQLTMRTFHTGGVFSSLGKREMFKAKSDGEVVSKLPTRDFRTRHGDTVQMTTRDCTLEIKGADGKTSKYNLPFNTQVMVAAGDKVKKDQIIASFEPTAGRKTERATKDITGSMSGEVWFDGFDADEKRDRQGNISRTANRPGTIWVLGGDVYNLPTGAKHMVQDGQVLNVGEIIAETHVVSEHGGEVRIPADLEIEEHKVGKETVKKIINGKDLTIIIASISPSNAELVQTKKEQLWKVGDDEETYIVKSPQGTSLENGSVVAELIDESMAVPTSGQIRYLDVEVDEQRILTQTGKILFLPEEIHQVSKDISLKVPGIESGMEVTAGTEIIKGITCQTDGIVEIVEENDIVREVVVRPGKLFRVDDISTLNVDDGTVVSKGTEVAPGIKATEDCVVTVNFQIEVPEDDDEDIEDTSDLEYAEVLLRPYQEFIIEPRKVKIDFESTDPDNITIVPVTQLQVKDGDKIRHIEGAPILRTSLVLQMKGYLERLKAVAEIKDGSKKEGDNLKVVVLENLTIRRENPSGFSSQKTATQTQLLVEDGQVIDKRSPVVKTQVITHTKGRVSLGNAANDKDVRRVLLITDDHETVIETSTKPTVKVGDFVTMDQEIAAVDKTPISGQVTAVDAKSVTIRESQPYLISGGTLLQVENRALTQRGDLIASLIFERQKTGDIVQGLPRVEELLEGRKPKESAIIAPVDGTVEIIWEEDVQRLYLTSINGREEISIPVGSNIVVENKQAVKAGQALTDGPINPHDILVVSGIEAVREYLVEEVQRVYRSQGVEIADKHIEVIVRQMTKKVRVDEAGDTTLLGGELVDEKAGAEANRVIEGKEGKLPAEYHPVLLGITKASLNTESFISAASFQETTRVLTEAAVEGKRDFLRGLKENVIIGRLIPAGTGFPHFKDERADMFDDAEQALAAKSSLRKPSAILEEIESMFGSPEISEETMESLLIDDSSMHVETIGGVEGEDEDYSSDAILDD
ncbi:DNA-directed RNA polymerase subunit beta'' [Vampirovibrio chlorellavorus]|uniref:DNA-directed RNA polymerase subunit beta'' n=1 Tax=Vampirovibrio chlorellavorus TaxID=758823 RepID=UPI0026E92FE6|nr:DNA-directed RNA polymerase subunit beta'' [Vampirovibrio chlorellavorus]